MDLRAKLERLCSMEPPAALFEPPPWAAAPAQPPLSAAEREQQLRAALTDEGLEADSAGLHVASAPPSSERPDLRRKLARLRSLNPPTAAAASPVLDAGAPWHMLELSQLTAASAQPAEVERRARLHSALRALQQSQLQSSPEAAPHPSPAGSAASVDQAALTHASAPHGQVEDARKARLRAAFRALHASQQRSTLVDASQLRSAVVDASQLRSAVVDAPQLRSALANAPKHAPSDPWQQLEGGSEPWPHLEARRGLACEPPPPLAAAPHIEQGRSTTKPPKAERIAQLRSLIAEVAARDRLRAPQTLPAARDHAPPPWLQEPTAHGPLHVCTRYLEPDHHHGHSPVRAALYERPGALSSLVCDPEYAGLDLSRALYLDTETTGLAGGTGTVAFLVGLARFEDASLCVEQLIVPQLGSETPVLARLAERLATASCLVTYNGKSFDWPLLRTRFVLARLPVPPVPPHIDLLHVCRRVWKERLPSVRLVDMEREVLRFEREDDLPGSEIPARYFEFLRGGSPERLCPVLEHNQNDLIALAALLGAVMEQYTGERALCSPSDALHYAKLALRARDLERARDFGQDALTHSECQRQARAALTLCAEIEHKLGRIPEAIAHLERALHHARQLGSSAATAKSELDALAEANLHFTLAKLYEHEQHDLVRALRHARHTESVEGPALHGRRLGRLVRRLLRSAADASV